LAAYPKTATNLVVRLAFGQSAFGPNIAEVPHYSKVFTGRGKQRVVSDCSLCHMESKPSTCLRRIFESVSSDEEKNFLRVT
jgi:hypothetical protein